jgi:hypothetical protein
MKLLKKTQSIITTPFHPITLITNRIVNSKSLMHFQLQQNKKIEKTYRMLLNSGRQQLLTKRIKYIYIKCPPSLILEHFEIMFVEFNL